MISYLSVHNYPRNYQLPYATFLVLIRGFYDHQCGECTNHIVGLYSTNTLKFHQGFPCRERLTNLRGRVKANLEIWQLLRFK